MTAVEMHHSFQMKSGLILDTYKVEKLLNEAQDIFVNRYADIYDTSESARKKIDILVKNYSIAPTANGASNISSNANFITLPADLRRVLQEHCLVTATVVNIKPIKYDQYNIEKGNPFKEPDVSELFWRLDYGDTAIQHEIIHDGSTITTYKMRYISNPAAISIFSNNTCVLNSRDHEEIVNIAVSLVSSNNTNKDQQ